MDFAQIKELVTLVDSTEITGLEIERDGFKLRIRKAEKALSTPTLSPVQGDQVLPSYSLETPRREKVTMTSVAPQERQGLVEFTSPMVGTFYRAPAPDAPPYIQVGDSIEEGQVLFIVEAMKMMNEIVAEGRGVVKEFLVENGQPVEYGQPLLLIDPRG